jgi:hypothetical protein
MSNVPNVNNPFMFVARASINTAVLAGVLSLLTGSTVMYSVAFTGIIVGFVAGSIYLFQKK